MKAAQLIMATCEEGQDFIPDKLKLKKFSPQEKDIAINKWRENDKRGILMLKIFSSKNSQF